MPVTVSTAVMVEKLADMLDTGELNGMESGFVRKLDGMRTADPNLLTRLSERQLEWLVDLHRRHFA